MGIAISNKENRIVRNTIIMFFRMLFLMVVGFLSSRWLLKQLGVEDYGIFSVVGSVTTTFVALRSLFSESIQRFFNYYKGKEDVQAEKEVFTISIIVHLILAAIFAVVLEIVGIWLINNKLVFPLEKYDTVIFVFQTTVIASIFSILSIPFDALIIANEKLGFFALVSVLDGLLRLTVVVSLPYLPFESLRAFSFLIVLIPITSLLLLSLYSRKFPECSFHTPFNKNLLKEILSLSGWNFFGNLSFSLLHEGINFILNIFGGLVFNAARAIAYQVKNIVAQFSSNSLIAVRPRVMQRAAIDDKSILYENIIEISRISFMIMLIPVVPLEAFCSELLRIWLIEFPDNAVIFTKLVLLAVLFRSFHEPFNMFYMSLGSIKRMIIVESTIMIASLAGIYIMLSCGLPMWSSFALLAVMEIFIIVALAINAHYEFAFPLRAFFNQAFIPMSLLFLVTELIVGLFSMIRPDGILATLVYCGVVLMCVMSVILLFLNRREKELVRGLIKRKK